MRQRSLLWPGLLAAAAVLGAAGVVLRRDEPSADWREEPIRYILNVAEDQAYKKLGTDGERRAFIERFWLALDPTPGTEENERREEFWRRVEEAGRLFAEGLQPGWKTDRGQVLILMGPPDGRTQGPLEIWTYVAVTDPAGPPEMRVGFRRTSDGEYHVIRDSLWFRDPLAESDGLPAGSTFLSVGRKPGEPGLIKGRIRMTDFPRGEVKVEEFVGPLEARSRMSFYRAGERATYVAVTLSTPAAQFRGADGGFRSPDLAWSVLVKDLEGRQVLERHRGALRADPAWSESAGRLLLFQGGFTLPPGAYEASLVIADRLTRRGLVRSERLEVPDFREDRLSLSSVAVGRPQAEPREAGESPSRRAVVPIPDPDPVFRQGEMLAFAYAIHGARQRRAQADLEVEYRFLLVTVEGERAVGRPVVLPHQKGPSLAYALPLAGWPAGDYILRIRVTDTVGGSTTTREERFRIGGPA